MPKKYFLSTTNSAVESDLHLLQRFILLASAHYIIFFYFGFVGRVNDLNERTEQKDLPTSLDISVLCSWLVKAIIVLATLVV